MLHCLPDVAEVEDLVIGRLLLVLNSFFIFLSILKVDLSHSLIWFGYDAVILYDLHELKTKKFFVHKNKRSKTRAF